MSELRSDPQRSARLVLMLRRQGITDDSVLSAIEVVDRAAFVADSFKEMAAENTTLPIPCGQAIPRPLVTARLLNELQLLPGDAQRILLIGAGSGYTATLLAQIGQHVCAIERYHTLAEAAHERLGALGVPNVEIFHGDGLEGLEAQGPFDRILLGGAVNTIPATLIAQLKSDGQLSGVVLGEKGQRMLRSYKGRQILRETPFNDSLGELIKGVSKAL